MNTFVGNLDLKSRENRKRSLSYDIHGGNNKRLLQNPSGVRPFKPFLNGSEQLISQLSKHADDLQASGNISNDYEKILADMLQFAERVKARAEEERLEASNLIEKILSLKTAKPDLYPRSILIDSDSEKEMEIVQNAQFTDILSNNDVEDDDDRSRYITPSQTPVDESAGPLSIFPTTPYDLLDNTPQKELPRRKQVILGKFPIFSDDSDGENDDTAALQSGFVGQDSSEVATPNEIRAFPSLGLEKSNVLETKKSTDGDRLPTLSPLLKNALNCLSNSSGSSPLSPNPSQSPELIIEHNMDPPKPTESVKNKETGLLIWTTDEDTDSESEINRTRHSRVEEAGNFDWHKCFVFLLLLSKNNNKAWKDKNEVTLNTIRDNFITMVAKPIQESICHFDILIKAPEGNNLVNSFTYPRQRKSTQSLYQPYFTITLTRGTHYAKYFFHVEPYNSYIAAGIPNPSPQLLRKIRRLIVKDHESIAKLHRYLDSPNVVALFPFSLADQDKFLKKIPKEFPADHSNWMLKATSFVLRLNLTNKQVRQGFTERCVETAKVLKGFVSCLNRIVDTVD